MGCGCSDDSSSGGEGGYLDWKTSVNYVFFKWWTANTPTSFAVSNVILFMLSFFYEGFLNYRARLDSHIAHTRSFPVEIKRNIGPFTVSQNFLRSILHAFSYYSSQVLMMIFMAYNGYFCTSLVLGRFSGYFFFSVFMPEKSTIGDRPKSCCG